MKKLFPIIVVFTFLFSAVLTVPVVHAQSNFKDVSSNHWAKDEIKYLTERGVISGFTDGKFRPEATITRTQAVQMLLREKKISYQNVKDPGFVDMKPNAYGYKEVAKAVELGIIAGKVNKKGQKIFDPNGQLTRAEMAKILSLAYDLKGESSFTFADVPKTHWAYTYIQGLAKNKVTVGMGNGLFGVNDKITRAQFSVMMARTVNESFRTTPTPPTTGGKTYPDGWVAPVLKSAWSPDPAVNYQTLQNELGFTNGGSRYSLPTYPQGVIHVVEESPTSSNEVTIKFYFWTDPYFKESYRIPIVAKEVFKLYFGADATRVWNYFNNNDIPDHFTANGRQVEAVFSNADGSVALIVGRK